MLSLEIFRHIATAHFRSKEILNRTVGLQNELLTPLCFQYSSLNGVGCEIRAPEVYATSLTCQLVKQGGILRCNLLYIYIEIGTPSRVSLCVYASDFVPHPFSVYKLSKRWFNLAPNLQYWHGIASRMHCASLHRLFYLSLHLPLSAHYLSFIPQLNY